MRCAIHEIEKRTGRNFVIFFISDFIDYDIPDDLAYLRARHDVTLVHVSDPMEITADQEISLPGFSPEGPRKRGVLSPHSVSLEINGVNYFLDATSRFHVKRVAVSTDKPIVGSLSDLFYPDENLAMRTDLPEKIIEPMHIIPPWILWVLALTAFAVLLYVYVKFIHQNVRQIFFWIISRIKKIIEKLFPKRKSDESEPVLPVISKDQAVEEIVRIKRKYESSKTYRAGLCDLSALMKSFYEGVTGYNLEEMTSSEIAELFLSNEPGDFFSKIEESICIKEAPANTDFETYVDDAKKIILSDAAKKRGSEMIKGILFDHVWILYLSIVIVPYALLRVLAIRKKSISYAPLQFGSMRILRRIALPFLLLLECAIVLCMVIALSGPHVKSETELVSDKGIDTALVLDVSASMQAADFKPNRLEALKKISTDFVRRSAGNRIAVYAFAKHIFTQSPMTTDHAVIAELIEGISYEMIDHTVSGGTAIGDALLMANDGLKRQKIEGRDQVIILISDGENNEGTDPLPAAKLVRENKIRLYVIGIGGDEPVEVFINGQQFVTTGNIPLKTSLDDTQLKEISAEAGGTYYRAGNANLLAEIFKGNFAS